MKNKKDLVSLFLKKGYLIGPDFLENIGEFNSEIFSKLNKKPLVLNTDIKKVVDRGMLDFNWYEFEKGMVSFEKKRKDEYYEGYLGIINNKSEEFNKEIFCKDINEVKNYDGNVLVLRGYKEKYKKREVSDFVNYFKCRFNTIKEILINRPELQNLVSIDKLKLQPEGKEAVVMGLVVNKTETKNGNLIIELEDVSGKVKLIISKNREEVFNSAKDIVFDEIIGVVGVNKSGVLFVNNLIYPEIATNHEIKKSPDECYVVFISDLHIGLNLFLKENFNNFIKWLNGDYGNEEQKEISKKIKYLFIAGDLVEGVGIYPGQDKDLEIKDIYKQYEYCAELLSKIPEKIKIIICAGNHDAVRMSEPQPGFDERFAKPLFQLKNVILVNNPSLINIHASQNFPGFNILLYHGFSFTYYADVVESIRTSGGMNRVDLVMHFLLKKRHLAPSHGSTLYIPDICEDPLVIDKIPDFFVTGHIHKVNVSNYKNITCINASCWASQTEDNIRRGIIPEPSKAVIVNLKNRKIKIMNFET